MNATATGEPAPASSRLPGRQREVLELREEGLSYAEIATKLETTPDRVGQLMAHAWINLYDEQVGTALASVAPTPDCERALGLIAARHDGELDAASADGEWLEAHLTGCHRCRRGVDEMAEAHALYRSNEEAAPRHRPEWRKTRPRVGVAVGVVALLAGAGLAVAFAGGDSTQTPAEPAVGATPRVADRDTDGTSRQANGEGERQAAKRASATVASEQRAGSAAATVGTTASAPSSTSVPVVGADGSAPDSRGSQRPAGQTALQPPQRVVTPRSKPRADAMPVSAAPASTAAPSAPAPPAPSPEPEAVPNGSAPAHSNRPSEPPGKAAGHPSG
jgi:Sigma-70, region 4